MMKKEADLKAIFHTQLKMLTIIVAFIACGSLSAFAQATDTEAKVIKIASETEDLIHIQVSVSETTFRRGDDISLNYFVTNKSKKIVYLVIEPYSYVVVEDLSILRVVYPVSGIYDHEAFKYDLIKILPRKSYRGKLLIKAKHYLEDKNYDFSLARIQVGFSYLFDKSKLDGCTQATFVRPCFYELYVKSKSLTLGNLVVRIKK